MALIGSFGTSNRSMAECSANQHASNIDSTWSHFQHGSHHWLNKQVILDDFDTSGRWLAFTGGRPSKVICRRNWFVPKNMATQNGWVVTPGGRWGRFDCILQYTEDSPSDAHNQNSMATFAFLTWQTFSGMSSNQAITLNSLSLLGYSYTLLIPWP